MAIVVGPTEPNPTHHIALTDSSSTQVGFITTDSVGDKKPLVSVSPYPTMASQLRQGSAKYADRVPPFEDIALSDFSGGLAMLHHDEDSSKYYDGKRVDTARVGEVINGPLETYTAGLRDFQESWPGNVTWSPIYTGGTTSLTSSFVSSSSDTWTAASVVFILKKVGSPTGTLTATFDIFGGGDSVSKSLTINSDCLTDLVSERVEFVFTSTKALTPSTSYIVSIEISGGSSDSSNYIEVAVDGSSYPYYRLLDDTDDFDGIFFELNGGLYFITQPLDKSDSDLYLYGDRGVADSNSGALTTLVDATKSWTNDEWIGGVVKIIAEDGTEEREPYRTITDNDSTTLTVSPSWNIEHTTETEYVILYPKWQKVQDLGGYCTDVAVGKYYADLCMDSGASQLYEVKEVSGAFSESLNDTGNWQHAHALITANEATYGQRDGGTLYDVQDYGDVSTVGARKLPAVSDNVLGGYLSYGLLEKAAPFNDTNGTGVTSYVNNGRIYIDMSGNVNGTIAHRTLDEPVDISDARYIEFRFLAAGSLSAGDLTFGIYDSEGNGIDINFPATTGGKSAYIYLTLTTAPGADTNYNEKDITDLYIKSTTNVNTDMIITKDSPIIKLIPHGEYYADIWSLGQNVQVTNMIDYIGGGGETVSRPWIFTWKGPWYKEGSDFVKLYLGEMSELEHPDNGKGACVNDVYLYFNVGETIQRYYSGHLDSVGPDVDYGLPETRRGIPISMSSYPGRVFAAIDAGTSGTSSVIYRRNHGWHEMYRAWGNERIRKIHIYARADTVDQLFVLEGADILRLPVSINPQTEADYEYNYESVLETSRIYGGLRETEKYYHAISLVTENLSSTHRWIEIDYRTSENSTWTCLGTDFTASPRQRADLSSSNNVTGRWIQFRFRMYTDDKTETPKLVSAILDSLERIDSANTYTYNIRLKESYDHDLTGKKETPTGKDKFDQLETWIDDPKPLTLNSTSAFEDGKLVFIEPSRSRVLYSKADDKGQEVRTYQLTLIEVD